MVSPLLEQRRHSLAIDVPSVGLVVHADEHRLVQVLSNLLSNAGHYTEQGGQIAITAYREADAIVIEVSDNGIGIAEDALVDINMPVMDGNELATRIRAQHSLEQRPYLVALTGYDQATDRQRSHAAGFNAHLVKTGRSRAPAPRHREREVCINRREPWFAPTVRRPGLPDLKL